MKTIRSLLIFIFCFAIISCSTRREKFVDPFVERERQWKIAVDHANSALAEGDLRSALSHYQNATQIKPNSAKPQLKIAEIYFQLNELEISRDAFVKYIAIKPKDVNARNYLGYIHETLGDHASAADQFQRSLKIDSQNLYAFSHLGLAFLQLKNFDLAEEILLRAIELDPNCERPESKNLHNYLATVYQSKGEIGEAIAEFREAIRFFPSDLWARQQLAQLFEDHQRYFEAQIQYTKILEIDPENLLTKDRLFALQNRDRVVAIDVPPVDLIEIDTDEIIANAPEHADYPNSDAIILLNQFSHEITIDGRTRYTTYQIVKIFNDRGIDRWDDLAIPHTPNAQNIAVNIARTILPNGNVIEPPIEAFNDITPPNLIEFNLYSDQLWRVMSMPALQPNSIIEYQVTVESATAEIGDSWFFGGFNFQNSDPTIETHYAFRLRKDRKFSWKSYNCEISPQIEIDGEMATYVWSYGETPALPQEIGMPPINEIVPRFAFSSVETWDQIAEWYRDLAKDRYVASENVEKLVKDLTINLENTDEKIRKIYHFVIQSIRYVGIELGSGAYQPTASIDVLRNRYGDCKDKSTLLITLLELIGVNALPALINPSPYDRVDFDLPSIGQFNHLIVLAKLTDQKTIWLDPTAETCPFGQLPTNVQDRRALVVSENGAVFLETPRSPAETNWLEIYTDLRLKNDGSISGVRRIRATGQYEIDHRFNYGQLTPNALREAFSAELNRQFPGVSVDQIEVAPLDDLDQPIEFQIRFTVPNFVELDGEAVDLPLNFDDFTDYAEIFSARSRNFSLDLNYPIRIERTFDLEIPNDWKIEKPADLSQNIDVGSFENSYRFVNGKLRSELVLTIREPIISVKKYADAKHFFDQIVKNDRTILTIVK